MVKTEPPGVRPCPMCDGNCDLAVNESVCQCCDNDKLPNAWDSKRLSMPGAPSLDKLPHCCGYPCYPKDEGYEVPRTEKRQNTPGVEKPKV